jgi:hypothetical protein
MTHSITRRKALASAAALLGAGSLNALAAPADHALRLATFSADVTPPLGHPLLAGLVPAAEAVDDPLFAHGLVLLGADQPVVLVAVDWCEIRNQAHDRWRAALAEAAGTIPARVLVTSIHQHDAPLADLEAQRLLEQHGLTARLCDPDFHEEAVQRVAEALRRKLDGARRATHIGLGQAKVEQIASNRRYLGPDGKPRFDRTSATSDTYAREQPEGLIDPWLKTLSFWDGDRPLAALNVYATHPMSYYGTGRVTSDFPGLARKRRQADDLSVAQLYASGASGNVTAGKFNDGDPANRLLLADRLYQAMLAAWKATQRQPLVQCLFKAAELRLEPRSSPGYTVDDLQRRLAGTAERDQLLAAMGLSWRKRADAGYRLDVPILDFGPAQLALLPGESYVEFQLLAQRLRPDSFVMTMGYGECAPGYIPPDKAFDENDSNLDSWCWVDPGAERAMTAALERMKAEG